MPIDDVVTVGGRTYVVVWDGSVHPSEGRPALRMRLQTQPGVLQGQILTLLSLTPDLSVGAVAAQLDRAPDRVMACLYRLLRRGLVTRTWCNGLCDAAGWRYRLPEASTRIARVGAWDIGQ